MTSSGVAMISSANLARVTPSTATTIPLISAKVMAVCTVSDISFLISSA